VQAEAAAGAGDERAFAHLQPADVAHAAEAGADGAGGDRRVGERNALGHHGDVVVLHRHVFAVAADHAVVAEELALGAQHLAAAAAEAAGAADVIALRRRHAVANFKSVYFRSNINHCAGNLVAQHAGHLHAGLEGAVARQDIVEAHAAGIDPDHHVARPGHRVRDGLQAHRIDAAGLPDDDRFHSGTNFTSMSSKQAFTRMPERI
jgi:hypothetical protein